MRESKVSNKKNFHPRKITILGIGLVIFLIVLLLVKILPSVISSFRHEETLTPSKKELVGWKIYSDNSDYQFSYPPTYTQQDNLPAVSAPDSQHPDGEFIVEEESGGKAICEHRSSSIAKNYPSLKQSSTMIDEYSAIQYDGRSAVFDEGGDLHDRRVIFVTKNDKCFWLIATSNNNPEQMQTLYKILSTFSFK